MRILLTAAVCWSLSALFCPAFVAAGQTDGISETRTSNDAWAARFVERYEAALAPLDVQTNLLDWKANVDGSEENFRKKQAAEEKRDLALADPEAFAELKAIRQAGVSDPLLARQIDVLYRMYLARQIPHDLLQKILAKENESQRKFSVFRPTLDGREVTDNDLRNILRESRDSDRLRAAWEASKQVGPVVIDDLKELIALRNEAARRLGFSDYHAMQLFLREQDREQLFELFDELGELTRGPFHAAKAEIDAALADRYGIAVGELRPWHYQNPFFQEAPSLHGELPDTVYRRMDTVDVCRDFYAGIGLPIGDVLARSDLYEKQGKNPHAFATDIDRAGDVRIFENIVPGREWMTTTMHELGHAAYSKWISRDLPYVLRNDAHILCTEGVAMMFERFPLNVDWMLAMGAEIQDPVQSQKAMDKQRRNRMLVFARWAQVMFRFEAALYANPDQDLNRLWWDLVEKYQEVKRPEGRDAPDFASKYHIIGAPAYYHNYMLGEMFASQLHHALVKSLGLNGNPKDAIYVGDKRAGEFLIRRVFAPGTAYGWNDFTRRATGEKLSAKAFAQDIGASRATEADASRQENSH